MEYSLLLVAIQCNNSDELLLNTWKHVFYNPLMVTSKGPQPNKLQKLDEMQNFVIQNSKNVMRNASVYSFLFSTNEAFNRQRHKSRTL